MKTSSCFAVDRVVCRLARIACLPLRCSSLGVVVALCSALLPWSVARGDGSAVPPAHAAALAQLPRVQTGERSHRACVAAQTWIMDGSSHDVAHAVGSDSKNGVFVAGQTDAALSGQSALGEEDAFVRKYDAHGSELWTRQFGTTAQDCALALSVDRQGGVLVVGVTSGALPEQRSVGGQDVFARKYDAAGREQWTRQFGTTGDDHALSVQLSVHGDVMIAGQTEGAFPGYENHGGLDAFVRKYNAAGTEFWTVQFGSDRRPQGAASGSVDAAPSAPAADVALTVPPQTSIRAGVADAPNPYLEPELPLANDSEIETTTANTGIESVAVPAIAATGMAEVGAPGSVERARTDRRQGFREQQERADQERQWSCAGDLSTHAIVRVVKDSMTAVRNCYERSMRSDGSSEQGRLRLRVKVGNDGAVAATDVSGDVYDQKVRACIQSVASHWNFPAPEGDTCAVFDAPYSFMLKK